MPATAFPLRPALDDNSTSSSFTAKIPTATEPSGSGVFDVFDRDMGLAVETAMPKFVQLIPFGTDANDETFDMRLWGWSKVKGEDLWIPQLLLDLNVTLGNIDGSAIGTNHFLADTLVIEEGDTDAELISTADDTPASVIVHLRGCQLIEFDFDLTGAAAANCYWRVMDEP